MSTVAVGILAYNGRAYLPACLDSVLAQTMSPTEIVVVDNASSDGSADLIADRYPQVRLIRQTENLGVGGGLNALLAATTCPLVVLLNQDIELRSTCLAALVASFKDVAVGVVGAKLLFPDGLTVQHAGGYLEWPRWLAQHYGFRQPDDGRWDSQRWLDYVTGAVLAVRRTAWDAVGGMDPLFSPAYFEETDFCLRVVAAGWRIVYQPEAVALHHESTTLGRESRAYLALYHRHRLLLTVRHQPPPYWLATFAPAEAEALAGLRTSATTQRQLDEVDALADAYAHLAGQLTAILARRPAGPVTAEQQAALGDRLAELHRLATEKGIGVGTMKRERDVAEVIEIRDPQIDVQAVMAQIRANVTRRRAEGAYRQNLDEIADQVFAEVLAANQVAPAQTTVGSHILPLAELQSAWGVREPVFTSNAPVVGPFIVLVRTAWNWMSTKWYVRIIIQQIQNFQLLTVRAFQDVDLEHRKLADQVQRLEAVIQQQQAELAELRAHLSWRTDDKRHSEPSDQA